MSHDLGEPRLRSPADDARLDLTDLYVFSVPGDRTVLIMNVNPGAPDGGRNFHPEAVYRIDVDTGGDNRADVAFSFVFAQPLREGGSQTVTVYRATGAQARSHEAGGEKLFIDAPVSFGPDPFVVESGRYLLSAGLRSDPFFADLDGILNGLRWTGADAMADQNVFGIVLEMPDAELGPDPVIGVWARVSLYQDGQLRSIHRGAHPSLTDYFHAEDVKDAYNAGEPAQDWANYHSPWTALLRRTGGYDAAAAERVLRTVLPDILRFDRSRPAAYPNGRNLTDDVTTARLSMISNGRVRGGNVGPHTDLLPEFPYLGTPHPVRAANPQS